MILVNLFGGPGVGKSTGAAYVFAMLKMEGINAELIGEFAKDKVWEENWVALKNQAYIFGKQFYKIDRCANQVDVVVTDSPILLSLIYNDRPALGAAFDQSVSEVFHSYDNLNYLLNRVKPYNPKGRYQDEAGAKEVHLKIVNLLHTHGVDYEEVDGDITGYQAILSDVLKKLQ